jgi:nickel-dependent lactate racemase
MQVEIPYGERTIKVELEEARIAGLVKGNDVKPALNERETILSAIFHPLNSPNLRDFLAGPTPILCIVNDGTRPTPTAIILEAIYNLIKLVNIRFLVATGAHRPPTEDEYRCIFGQLYDEFKSLIYPHNSRSASDMVYITRSRNGTDVYLNKMVAEAQKIFVISSVEPHYFAGFTGGRKSFLPGIASHRSIEQNHHLAMSPLSKPLALDGNPVHDDMVDTLATIRDKAIFSIQTVLDNNQCIYSMSTGDINDSFAEAVSKAREVFVVGIKEKTDIVVTVARHPFDIDLYQSQKALENGKLALKTGGIIILVSECRCGVGDDTFLRLLSTCMDLDEILARIEKGYKLGYHKAAKIVELRQWADIYGVTSLPDNVVKAALITPFSTLQKALDIALSIKGRHARVLFLLDGAVTVPSIT